MQPLDQSTDAQIRLPELRPEVPSDREDSTAQQTVALQSDDYLLRELVAQESMAHWAMVMGVAALLTFAVTVVGTSLIWFQVRYTRKAVEETTKSTNAMREANATTRSMGEAQTRAYLSVTARSLTLDEESWLDFVFSVANAGQSPARNVLAEYTCTHVNRKDRYHAASGIAGLGDLRPGSDNSFWFSVDFTEELRKAFEEKSSVFSIEIKLSYDTVFDGNQGGDVFRFVAFAHNPENLILQPEKKKHMGHTQERRKRTSKRPNEKEGF